MVTPTIHGDPRGAFLEYLTPGLHRRGGQRLRPEQANCSVSARGAARDPLRRRPPEPGQVRHLRVGRGARRHLSASGSDRRPSASSAAQPARRPESAAAAHRPWPAATGSSSWPTAPQDLPAARATTPGRSTRSIRSTRRSIDWQLDGSTPEPRRRTWSRRLGPGRRSQAAPHPPRPPPRESRRFRNRGVLTDLTGRSNHPGRPRRIAPGSRLRHAVENAG